MNSAIHPLGSFNTGQLQEVVQLIVEAVSPEYIFLLGASCSKQQAYNIFSDKVAGYQQVTHYDVLVLLPLEDKRSIDEVQDIIESRCRAHTPVTVIVFTVRQFNALLTDGHAFCCSVHTSGLKLYDKGNIPLQEPRPCDKLKLQAQARKAFSRWCEGADEFLAGAELFSMRKQFSMAAFMLHQVAERSYVALIQVMTGYRAGTHNLDKLMRYTRSFSSDIFLLFPRNTEKEEHLFRQLQKAYIHSRYREDFVVTAEEARELMERVRQLLNITKQLCQQRIEELAAGKLISPELVCIGRAV